MFSTNPSELDRYPAKLRISTISGAHTGWRCVWVRHAEQLGGSAFKLPQELMCRLPDGAYKAISRIHTPLMPSEPEFLLPLTPHDTVAQHSSVIWMGHSPTQVLTHTLIFHPKKVSVGTELCCLEGGVTGMKGEYSSYPLQCVHSWVYLCFLFCVVFCACLCVFPNVRLECLCWNSTESLPSIVIVKISFLYGRDSRKLLFSHYYDIGLGEIRGILYNTQE